MPLLAILILFLGGAATSLRFTRGGGARAPFFGPLLSSPRDFPILIHSTTPW
jgi:hypothetical protein